MDSTDIRAARIDRDRRLIQAASATPIRAFSVAALLRNYGRRVASGDPLTGLQRSAIQRILERGLALKREARRPARAT